MHPTYYIVVRRNNFPLQRYDYEEITTCLLQNTPWSGRIEADESGDRIVFLSLPKAFSPNSDPRISNLKVKTVKTLT